MMCEKGMSHSELGSYMVSSFLALKVEPSLPWVTFDMQEEKSIRVQLTALSAASLAVWDGKMISCKLMHWRNFDGHMHDGSHLHVAYVIWSHPFQGNYSESGRDFTASFVHAKVSHSEYDT